MATTYRFEYGTSSSYGLQTAEVDAGSGTGAVDASATLTGLTSDTTYHYRVVATNAAGVTRGSDRTLKTDARPGPPGATTGSARNVTAVGARLSASVDPNGRADDLPLRVRHEHELRQAHRRGERGQRAERAQRERGHLGPERQHALPLPRRGDQRRGRRARARPQLRHAAQPAGDHRLRLAQPGGLERLDHRQREGERAGRRRRDRRPGAPGLPLRRPLLPGGDQEGGRATARSPSRSGRCGRWRACA